MVMMVVVMVAVVFVVPVSFMDLPALLVVIVMRMGPVGARVGRSLPNSRDPDIATATLSPVSVDPCVAFSWHRRSYLIADGWGRGADVNLDLAECRGRQDRCGEDATQPFCFQLVLRSYSC